VFLDGTFISLPRGKNRQGTGLRGSGDQARWRKEDPRVLALRRTRVKHPEFGRRFSKISSDVGGPTVRIFVTDDLPGLEKTIKKIFPESDWQLCVLHAVRYALNKARKKDREALAEALKKIYRAETEEEAEEALGSLWKRWDKVYPKIVEQWETKAYALLAFLRYHKPIRHYLYTTNRLERLAKEVKRRAKVVEVFCGEGTVERLLYLVLSQLDEAWGAPKPREFAEIHPRNYHVALTQ